MCDQEHGALFGGALHGPAQRAFAPPVEMRDRLVQQQDLRAAQEYAGDGQALALTAGEDHAPCFDGGVQAIGQSGDVLVEQGLAQYFRHLFLARVRRRVQQVLPDGAGEHGSVLLDVGDAAAHLGTGEGADVHPVQQVFALVWVIAPLEEREDRGLSAAGRPDHRRQRAGRCDEGDLLQRGGTVGVTEGDVPELCGELQLP